MKLFRESLAVALASALAWPAQAAPLAPTQIGVAAAVHGRVQAFAPANPVGRVVESGKPLYLNEKISTDGKGRLQIMLLDETVFTIGPNSEMVLDEFVYDPETSAGKVSASVTKGVFRFITGRVAQKDPSQMKVKFPVGTMGIRGTIVAGRVDAGGTTAVLLGPGAGNNAGERAGAFSLDNAGASVEISRPGFGSTISGMDQPPSPPTLIPPVELNAMLGDLAARGPERQASPPEGERAARAEGQKGQEGEAPGPQERLAAAQEQVAEMSPEQKAELKEQMMARINEGMADAPPEMRAQMEQEMAQMDPDQMLSYYMMGDPEHSASEMAGQDMLAGLDHLYSFDQQAAYLDPAHDATFMAALEFADQHLIDDFSARITFWEDLRHFLTSGTGVYSGSGAFYLTQCQGGTCGNTTGPHGTLNFTLRVNFGAQTIGGGDSGASFSATDSPTSTSAAGSLSIASQSYAGLSGQNGLFGISSNGAFQAQMALANTNVVAGEAGILASYDNLAGTKGHGLAKAPLTPTAP